MFTRPSSQSVFRGTVPGPQFAGAVHPVQVTGPEETCRQPTPQGDAPPPAIQIPEGVGSDLLTFLADVPCDSEELRERRSGLLSRAWEVVRGARAFALQAGQAHQKKLVGQHESLELECRKLEDEIKDLQRQRGSLVGPLNVAGERRGRAETAWRAALEARTESRHPTPGEKQQIRDAAEKARRELVEAQDAYSALANQTNRLDGEIDRAKKEFAELEYQELLLRSAIEGQPMVDRGTALIGIPKL
jgi:hypothetical protein